MTQLIDAADHLTHRLGSITRSAASRSFQPTRPLCVTSADAGRFKEVSMKGDGSAQLQEKADLSGVRLSKVAALKAAIESGSYHVSASVLADKLIDVLTK